MSGIRNLIFMVAVGFALTTSTNSSSEGGDCLLSGCCSEQALQDITIEQQVSTSAQANEMQNARTFGGLYFWSDVVYNHGWRIQKHAWYDQFRLIDERKRRHESGTLAECKLKLNEIAAERGWEPLKGHVVIVLHGLGRTRRSMRGLEQFLDQEMDGTVIRLGYASTRDRIEQHAEALDQVIKNLPEVESFSFVAHSMGNLVVRRMLKLQIERDGKADHRFYRMVMIAPPNQGALMARRLRWSTVFHLFSGRSGRQLSTQWTEIESKLAVPTFEFGIVSGGLDGRVIRNPFIGRPSDLIVTVDETKLSGATDFLTVNAAHTFIMDHAPTRQATLRFLTQGCFRENGITEPLEKD